MNQVQHEQFSARIEQYMLKAIREAKIHSNWLKPEEPYEEDVRLFIRTILKHDQNNSFLNDLKEFIKPIAKAGMLNSLVQVLLKMTSPGIPDLYQGNELWEFALVDPDNRHPVDYSKRAALLEAINSQNDPSLLLQQMLENREDGRIKLFVTFCILNYRRSHAQLFSEGSYLPLALTNEDGKDIVAFARIKDNQVVIIVARRFFFKLLNQVPSEKMTQIHIVLPKECSGQYRDIISGATLASTTDFILTLPDSFHTFPLMFLERIA